MGSMKESLEKYATDWTSKGCGDDGLLGEWELFCAKCWIYSDGAKESLYSVMVEDLIEMSEKKMPDNWWDHYLYQKTHCQSCGMAYKVENLAVCTGCYLLRCHKCSFDETIPLHPNGNKACSCGGEIVG